MENESKIIKNLRDAATEAMRNTHCPYSMYPVGVAILSEEGNIHIGSNVENAAYPQSICAEANAIGSMVVAGDKKIARVYLMSPNGGSPCGGCLQKLSEFIDNPDVVEVYSKATKRYGEPAETWLFSDLLPHRFDKNELFEHVNESQKRSPISVPSVWTNEPIGQHNITVTQRTINNVHNEE